MTSIVNKNSFTSFRAYILDDIGFFYLLSLWMNLPIILSYYKATREKKKIKAQSIAVDLCLGERHIISIENNSLQYFASKPLKYVALKKYIAALGLKNEDVIFNFNEVDPTPSLLKKT